MKFLTVLSLLGASASASAYTLHMQESGWNKYEDQDTQQKYILNLNGGPSNIQACVNISCSRNSAQDQWGNFAVNDAWIYTISSVEDTELPDSITFDFQGQNFSTAINKLGDANNKAYFQGGWDDKFIVIPSNYTQINIDGYFADGDVYLEMQSATPPTVSGLSNVNVLVDNSNFQTYENIKNTASNGWDSTINIIPINIPNSEYIVVNVQNAGDFETELLADSKVNNDPQSVYGLKITGNINSRDMMYFENLKYLSGLDLSGVTIVGENPMVRGCAGLKFLSKVELPSTVSVIGANAFDACFSLQNINLGNITEICGNAFNSCGRLQTADLGKVTSIGEYAFNGCQKIDNIDLSSVEYVKGYAFNYCSSLSSVDLSNCKEIGNNAFCYCESLANVKVSRQLQRIENGAFNFTALKDFTIHRETYVGSEAFLYSKTENLSLESNKSITSYTFRYMGNLKNLYCYDPFPHQDKIVIESEAGNRPTIYVPKFALSKYDNNENYFEFGHVSPLPNDLSYLDVYDNLDIDSTEGLTSKFDMDIKREGSFRNNSAGTLQIGTLIHEGEHHPSSNNGFDQQAVSTSSYISNGSATADAVIVRLHPEANDNNYGSSNRWSFISFPFDVKVGDIVPPENTLWVVRKYNGKTRADRIDSSVSAWENLSADSVMKAGKGYILHYTVTDGSQNDYYNPPYFTFPALNSTRDNYFCHGDVEQQLDYFQSAYAHNESWNLIGNPYPSYYNIRDINYDGPITVWRNLNGSNTYEAFNLTDDEFVLIPFEAFFVQGRQSAADSKITFGKDGRYPTFEEATQGLRSAVRQAPGHSNRRIFNVHISGEKGGDRTRLVVNDEASEAYELNCDASKFLSPSEETPQVYMLEGDLKMAINERPIGSGVFPLGVKIGVEGIYTINAYTRNAGDYTVILKDNVTGSETDITEEDYSFNAKPGYDNNRFIIVVVPGVTTVEGVESAKASVSVKGNILTVVSGGKVAVYSIDGTVVAEAEHDLQTELASGVYVVKTAEGTTKVFVAK